MDVSEMVKRIEKFEDFYGQDIVIPEPLKTEEDCRNILQRHHRFLEDQNVDARNHLESFINELGLG
jgi:hypothetical protein